MKRLSLYLLTPALFLLTFYGACSETSTKGTQNYDSLKIVARNAQDSVRAYKQLVTINHLTIERLNASLQDVSFDLNAEREHFQDMRAKYENRLDSAVAIIRRQQEQLSRCVIDGRIK